VQTLLGNVVPSIFFYHLNPFAHALWDEHVLKFYFRPWAPVFFTLASRLHINLTWSTVPTWCNTNYTCSGANFIS
jgi:hypothetical protein